VKSTRQLQATNTAAEAKKDHLAHFIIPVGLDDQDKKRVGELH
jgi:hypothetical protein